MAALTNPEAHAESAHNFTFILDRCLASGYCSCWLWYGFIPTSTVWGSLYVRYHHEYTVHLHMLYYTFTLHSEPYPLTHSLTLSHAAVLFTVAAGTFLSLHETCSVAGVIRVSVFGTQYEIF